MSENTIIRGRPSIGLVNSQIQIPTLPLPEAQPSERDIIDGLMSRMTNLETVVEGKADASKVRTLIAFSDESILIKAQDIVLAGDVTIAKIINEQNGTTSGELPESITRIIGNRVQTGHLISNNWGASAGSFISLDDGVIIMGGSESPAFVYDDGDISITGTLTAGSVIADTVTVDGATLGSIKTNAGTGANHAGLTGSNPHNTPLSTITGDLDDIADGSSYYKSTYTQNIGAGRAAAALDSSNDYIRAISSTKITVSGVNPMNGVVIDSAGLRGYAGGVLRFNINSSGTAYFSGDISGATGTFSGNIVSAGQLKVTGSTSTGGFYGNFSAVVQPSTVSVGGLLSESHSAHAIIGYASNHRGVQGGTGAAASFGVVAYNNGGGFGLRVENKGISRTKNTDGKLSLWAAGDNTFIGQFWYQFE